MNRNQQTPEELMSKLEAVLEAVERQALLTEEEMEYLRREAVNGLLDRYNRSRHCGPEAER